MKEKEIAILDAAIRLFAKKGFNATSIQEIVNEAGISKGAFYLYFKSKESLLMAIFRFYFDEINKKVLALETEGFSPREQFRQQLIVYCNEVRKHKDFIIMQARENALPFNQEVEEFMIMMRTNTFRFYRSSLLSIYGAKAGEFINDCTVLLKGMVDSYLEFIMFDQASFDLDQWSEFLLRRMDDVMDGLQTTEEFPVINDAFLKSIKSSLTFTKDEKDLGNLAGELREMAALQREPGDYIEAADILSEELSSPEPRKAVIRGMLANLSDIPEAERHITEIASRFGL